MQIETEHTGGRRQNTRTDGSRQSRLTETEFRTGLLLCSDSRVVKVQRIVQSTVEYKKKKYEIPACYER